MLLVVLTFFVFLSAVAMCVQAAMLIGIRKTTKQLEEQASSVLPQVRSVLTKAEATLEENRRNIAEVTAKAAEVTARASEIAAKVNAFAETANQIAGKANDMMDVGKVQMQRLDVVIADATERARIQLERAELVVDDTMSRVHHSVTAVHNGILRPIREIQGLTAGLRAMMQTLMRGGRPSVADVTHDDEMFIG